MSLQAKLDAFKADFEAGKPPYSVPRSVIETMHRATAELIEIDGRRLVFKVEAHDEKQKIGEGWHERFIVNLEKFLQRLN